MREPENHEELASPLDEEMMNHFYIQRGMIRQSFAA
jgi:hypothetical protein